MGAASRAGGRAGWREKYRAAPGGADNGREGVCVYLASYWHGLLVQLADGCRAAGVKPWVDPDSLVPAMVLTLDNILPPEAELTPEMVAVGGSSALLVQRWLNRNEIRAARERQDFEARWKKQKPASAEASPAPAEPTEPPPPTAIVTIDPPGPPPPNGRGTFTKPDDYDEDGYV